MGRGRDAQPVATVQMARLVKDRFGLAIGKLPITRRHQVDDHRGTEREAYPETLLAFEAVGLQRSRNCRSLGLTGQKVIVAARWWK